MSRYLVRNGSRRRFAPLADMVKRKEEQAQGMTDSYPVEAVCARVLVRDHPEQSCL